MSATADISELALSRFERMCEEMNIDKLSLAGVMFSESGWYSKAQNPNGLATGLIQFMPSTLAGLGFESSTAANDRAADFRKLDATAQMPFVRRYMVPGNLHGVAECYLKIFLPADIKHANEPDYVLAAKDGFRSVVFTANAGFDINRDYRITVSELVSAVARNCRGPRWSDLVSRLSGGAVVPSAEDGREYVVGTTKWIQYSLKVAGFDPGELDGVMGPNTHAALVKFQVYAKLNPDGIFGPKTKAALLAELTKDAKAPQ